MEYTNEPLWYIMEPFIELMTQEFKGSEINMDDNVGSSSFFLHDMVVEKIDNRGSGDVSLYTFEIVRDISSVKRGEKVFVKLSKDAARLDRLVFNNRNFTIPLEWSTWAENTWSGITTEWHKDRTRYCWFDAWLKTIDFIQTGDIEEGHHQVRMTFECNRERVI